LSQKFGDPEPKTGGKLRLISIPDLGDRSHCPSHGLNAHCHQNDIVGTCRPINRLAVHHKCSVIMRLSKYQIGCIAGLSVYLPACLFINLRRAGFWLPNRKSRKPEIGVSGSQGKSAQFAHLHL